MHNTFYIHIVYIYGGSRCVRRMRPCQTWCSKNCNVLGHYYTILVCEPLSHSQRKRDTLYTWVTRGACFLLARLPVAYWFTAPLFIYSSRLVSLFFFSHIVLYMCAMDTYTSIVYCSTKYYNNNNNKKETERGRYTHALATHTHTPQRNSSYTSAGARDEIFLYKVEFHGESFLSSSFHTRARDFQTRFS